MPKLDLSFSPCPNDIYTYFGWINSCFEVSLPCQAKLRGIEELNEAILRGEPELSKASFLTFAQAWQNYVLLPVGGAFGYGVGPKLLARTPLTSQGELGLQDRVVLVPGKHTTAYLLLRYLWPAATKVKFCAFDEVIGRLQAGEGDLGLVVHEARFAVAQHGLYEVADCGALWQARTGYPLPLGCLLARRTLPKPRLQAICEHVRRSLQYADSHSDALALAEALVAHSQEKDLRLAMEHVRLYVNADTARMTPAAYGALSLLLNQAVKEGLAAPFALQDALYTEPAESL